MHYMLVLRGSSRVLDADFGSILYDALCMQHVA